MCHQPTPDLAITGTLRATCYGTPMRRLSSVRLPALLLVLAGTACSGGGGFPSLAQRPAEIAFAAGPPPVASIAPGVADPALLQAVAALRAAAARAHEGFARSAQAAAQLAGAAKARPIGSEAWAAATTALGALDSAHGRSSLVLANLDALQARTALAAAAGNDPSDQATFVAVSEADGAVTAIVRDEGAQIAALHAQARD